MTKRENDNRYTVDDLLYLMSCLRAPDSGCPWDLKQSYRSITPSTLEEVYEVVDAIERSDVVSLKEELGDLLFQIIFYAQLASEDNAFRFEDIVDALTQKLVRRHPHVFPSGDLYQQRLSAGTVGVEDVNHNWEAIKQAERESKGLDQILDDVPLALPSLPRAQKLQKRMSKLGMDWHDVNAVFTKLYEEIDELKEAVLEGDQTRIQDEMGDVLFSSVNLARHLKLDADQSLRSSNVKFTERVHSIEAQLENDGTTWAECSPEQLDIYWQAAKKK